MTKPIRTIEEIIEKVKYDLWTTKGCIKKGDEKIEKWMRACAKASREDVVGQIIDQYKIIRTDEAFVTYLNSLREDNL